MTATVQGYGNAGYWFSHFAAESGIRIIAISDSTGAVIDRDGLDVEKLKQLKNRLGSLKKTAEQESLTFITNSELLTFNVDLLVPAALENEIDKENMEEIQAGVIVELANGPTTFAAEKHLTQRHVDVLPDILCNCGGVVASYFEWVQNLANESWSEETVFKKIEEYLVNAFHAVDEVRDEKGLTYRQAANVIAMKRIFEAEEK